VPHTDSSAGDFLDDKWLSDNLHTYLIPQVVSEPVVVIAAKKIEFDSAVAQGCKFPQHSDRTTWYHIAILHPKVKYVAEQIETFGLIWEISQKIKKTSLTCLCRTIIDPQMYIRHKYMK
jgi:hypothetical protein